MTVAEAQGTVQYHHALFLALLDAVADKARAVLPQSHSRIDKAVAIVLDGGVTLLEHGAVVQSQSRPDAKYSVNGTCACPDAAIAPDGFCKHRISAGLLRRTQEAVARQTLPIEELPAVEEPAPTGIDRRFIVHLHGKPFVRYSGLLQLAHERGLVKLDVRIEHHTDSLVLASATATFSDGRTFTEWADSSPSNVGAQVKAHWIRMALTRAKARCLRDALNVSECAVEELGEAE